MALNIKELTILADRFDKEGQHKEANEIDEMIKKLAVSEEESEAGIFPTPGEVEERQPYPLTEEEMRAKFKEIETKPDPQELIPQESVGLSDELKASLAELMDQNWNIFSPGELEEWLLQTQILPSTEKDEKRRQFKEELAKLKGRGVRSTETKRLQERFPSAMKELGETEASCNNMFEKLADIADRLDKLGATEEATLVDGFIEKYADDNVLEYKGEDPKADSSKAYDSKYHHSLQIREPKTKQERVDREGRDKHHVENYRPIDGGLSQRTCPDHIGVQLGRVGEHTMQCPIDGQIFNWETGFVDGDGKETPGGSVAGQTPDSSGYFEVPHRMFDSREQILNRIN